jgi:hypothetical protein
MKERRMRSVDHVMESGELVLVSLESNFGAFNSSYVEVLVDPTGS